MSPEVYAHNADAIFNVRYEISETLGEFLPVIVLVLFLFSHCRLIVSGKEQHYWEGH